MKYRKKLIEVGLPLDAINEASSREKSIRHGHPSTFHLWWARRPLAAARAIIFSQIVDDPSSCPDEFRTIEEQRNERRRLFQIIEELVEWKNTNNQRVLSSARREIALSIARDLDSKAYKSIKNKSVSDAEVASFLRKNAPRLHDPFAGGGSIPMEAGRLGLNVVATDLNPVAVLINRAQLELPRRWVGLAPVNPKSSKDSFVSSDSIHGLIEDVQYYAKKLMVISQKKLKKHYPSFVDKKKAEREIIAWIWVRTVPSPDPAAKGAYVPLADTFWLSQKKAKKWWVQPIVNKKKLTIDFEVKSGVRMDADDLTGTKLGRGAFKCIITGATIMPEYIRAMGKQGLMKARLMAIAVDGSSGREYFSPTDEHELAALSVNIPDDAPSTDLPEAALGFRVQNYGLTKHSDLFTARQLEVLCTFSDSIEKIHEEILKDCSKSQIDSEQYSRDIVMLLVLAIGKLANRTSSQCFWDTGGENVQQVFARQALPMIWTFAEGNPFSNSSGNWMGQVEFLTKALLNCPTNGIALVQQYDARKIANLGKSATVISTDPPYYDNVGYADLSDFFYVWLRKAGNKIIKNIFTTVLTPKDDEIISEPSRHKSKDKASEFFEQRLGEALKACDERSLPNYPVTIYYAFKQSESSASENGQENISSTGWETFLSGVLKANFRICGTYPIRTEQASGLRQVGRNALASSVVLVCRAEDRLAKSVSRREFIAELKRELPIAIHNLQESGLAAVDLQQAAIGPGMAVFSKYSSVLEADDSPMSIRSALVLINQILDEVLVDADSAFDSQTRWAIAWFETYGYKSGPFGEANTLAQAKNIGLESMVSTGLITSKSGQVTLLHYSKLKDSINFEKENIQYTWLQMHYLIKVLEVAGEESAGILLGKFSNNSGQIRDLAYRCYAICEKNGWAQDALSFNGLVSSWNEILKKINLKNHVQDSFEM